MEANRRKEKSGGVADLDQGPVEIRYFVKAMFVNHSKDAVLAMLLMVLRKLSERKCRASVGASETRLMRPAVTDERKGMDGRWQALHKRKIF